MTTILRLRGKDSSSDDLLGHDNPMPVYSVNDLRRRICKAYEAITVSTSTIGFTAALYTQADSADCIVENNGIRYRFDQMGPAPTATVGNPAGADKTFTVTGRENLAQFLAIRSGGANAILHVNYFLLDPAEGA